MNTAPFQDAEESLIELQPLREAVAVCIEELNEEDRWIINGIMSESLSLQQIAKQLGVTKTHVWRLRNRAFERLQNIMERHPEIRRRVRVAEHGISRHNNGQPGTETMLTIQGTQMFSICETCVIVQ